MTTTIVRKNYEDATEKWIKTADYLFRGEKWDLKIINGNGRQTIYHSVYGKNKQSRNFILDVSNLRQEIDKIVEQVCLLYNRKDTAFLDKVIIKNNSQFIIIQRKECDRAGNSARPHSL